jgi:tetratricopeptide (TPR) repeat protein
MLGRLLHLLAACCLTAAFLTISEPCLAQEPAKASDEQIELNDEALEAISDGNHARAASLLEESIHLGELNVTYLNLGRAYQLLGRCEAAQRALDKAEDAPQVASPAPELVDKKIDEYRADVDATCEQEEPDEAAEAPIGESADEEGSQSPPPNTSHDGSRRTWGYAALGSGVAVGVGAGLLKWGAASRRADIDSADTDGDGFADTMTRQQALTRQDHANLFDTLALSGAVVSGTLIGTGLYLIFTAEPSTSQVSVTPGSDSVNVTWKVRF